MTQPRLALLSTAALALAACGQPAAPTPATAAIDGVTAQENRPEADLTVPAPRDGVSAQLFDRYEFRNVVSNPGNAGAEAYLGEVKPAGTAQTASISVTRTLSSSRTITTGFGIGVDGGYEFAKAKIGANGSFRQDTSNSYTVTYTQTLTPVVQLKANQGVRFYGYLTGRYYSYDVRKCSLGCSGWLRQTIFVPEGIGVRPQTYFI